MKSRDDTTEEVNPTRACAHAIEPALDAADTA